MNQTEQNYQPYYDDEITLKELILKIQEFWAVLWRNKILIIVVALLLGAVAFFWNTRKPALYTSALTFMVGESDNKNGGLMASPFDQIQFEGIKNHKITEIARASQIVHRVLLTKQDALGLMCDRIVDIYKLKVEWEDYDWDQVNFSSGEKEKFNNETKKVFDELHEFLVGNKLRKGSDGLMSISYDDKTEIFKMQANSLNGSLSADLISVFYNHLSEFYVDRTVGKAQRTYDQLKVREDSLMSVLNKVENELAYSSDRTRGVVSSVARVNKNRISRKLDNVTSIHNDVRANRQKIEYVLQTETPDFQIIDQTFVPIMVKSSSLKSALIGGFLGAFLTCLFIIGRHIIRSALAE